MRRQSVLGFTQLLGRRHSSMQLADRRASADAPASAAAVRRGTGLRRAISIRWGRLKKEAADESASGSSDEGASGRDSDDTLTARDKANPPDAFAGTAPASASTSASDRGSPLASDQGSQATSTAAPTVRSSTSVRLLAGFGDDHGGSARKSSIDGSGRAKRPATHSEHVGWTHSRLSLIPQPTAAERARMDAWAADGDEFLPDEYDLSGVHFELVCTPARFQVARGVSDTAYGGIPTPRSQASPAASRRADGSGSKCTTPGSRVSSTPTSASTVVDDDALSAEQYRRVFVSSAHKLRWPCQGRDMSSIVHVRRIMAKANERYAAAAGRQLLDAGLEPYQLAAADMCGYGDVELMLIGQLRGGIMLPAEAPCRATPQHSDEAPHNAPVRVAAAPGPENGDLEAAQYPARVRSIGCIQRLRHVTQTQTQDSQGQEQDAADAGEPVYGPGALWTGPGDLVSLDPAAQGSAPQGPVRSGGILEGGGRVVAAYQPYRRQRWRRSARRSAFVAVAQL
ncbi:hypothetical protein H4R18_001218 [Coemansia javaensis]|uniref:Uncharacterized protein n=1 Tax=Coemansia javaensis TaxID=2761396 RepID=A0A9W8LL20_9FUNG|nr:hypothetical protein H4R18_001218 [Coemansia javaensis]